MSLQIKENAFYKRRDGAVRGPAEQSPAGVHHKSYPWIIGNTLYTDDGRYNISFPNDPLDLIEEVNADGSPIAAQETFEGRLCDLINQLAQETASNTPDFLLAKYLLGCMQVYASTVTARDEWYDFAPHGLACALRKDNETLSDALDESERERRMLKADLASSKATHDKLRKDADFLVEENTRLQAELDALKPKPVVTKADAFPQLLAQLLQLSKSAAELAVACEAVKRATCDGVTTAHLEEV